MRFNLNKLIYILLFLPSFAGAQISDSAQRLIKLQGATNVRDLGGYATKDGHHVKWNMLYRSADIRKLTQADLDTLQQRNITTVVDFRGTSESQAAPDKLNLNTDYILCPAGSDENMKDWAKKLVGLQSGGDSMMKVFYANTEFLAARYKPFFQKLLTLPNNKALLFHCTAGKDRTGIGAALLLYALGVPNQTIMEDYLASNIYRKASNEKMVQQMVQQAHINEQVATDIASVKQEYLQATYTALIKQYGSIDNFLIGPAGLTVNDLIVLRNKFLQ